MGGPAAVGEMNEACAETSWLREASCGILQGAAGGAPRPAPARSLTDFADVLDRLMGLEVIGVFGTRILLFPIRLPALLLLSAALSLGQAGCDATPTPTTAADGTESPATRPPPPPTFTPTLAPTPEVERPDPAHTTPTPQPTATPDEVSPTPFPAALMALRSTKTRAAAPGATETELTDLTHGNTAFAFDLYRALAQGEDNLFYSPYSVSLALAMTYAGAKGETERQMADTLRFDLPQDRLHPAFNALDLALASRGGGAAGQDDGEFRLNIANSVWGQEGHEFVAAFLDVLAEQYGSEVRRADFRRAPDEARVQINDWVADATEDQIEHLIPPRAIDAETRLVLANAIYFNAAWQLPFDERATAPRPFHPLGGGYTEAPMMRQEGRFGYVRGNGLQAVELLYDGGEMSMIILLPDEGRFREFEGSLDSSVVDEILMDLETRPVLLTMPKFELEAAFSLADTLKAMGMPNAFDEKAADFSGMDGTSCLAGDDECLLIKNVVHQAFVSVDEAGTEAAAATAAIVGIPKSVEPEAPITLTIDRPFVFLVRDRATDAVLFVGRVAELGQSG